MKINYLLASILLSLALMLSIGCKKDEETPPDDTPGTAQYGLGLTNTDDMSQVPSSTNFGFGADNLPASYNIIDKFPPIGDQGEYGTCVGWAVGYNGKTVINGIEKGYNSNDLSSTNKQFSPKDLFTAVEDSKKGENCGGTNFENALQVLQDR